MAPLLWLRASPTSASPVLPSQRRARPQQNYTPAAVAVEERNTSRTAKMQRAFRRHEHELAIG